MCILEFLRGSITIYLFSSTLSLTFSLHVDLYKAKARVIGMRSSSPARVRARIGILSRANHVTSALRIGEQSESLCHFIDMRMVQMYGNIWGIYGIYHYENQSYAISCRAGLPHKA